MTKLSEKAVQDLKATVIDFCETDGIPKREANSAIKDALSGHGTFLVWDALGCDDLGLVKENPELIELYHEMAVDVFPNVKELQNRPKKFLK